jgi:hypothetical protein
LSGRGFFLGPRLEIVERPRMAARLFLRNVTLLSGCAAMLALALFLPGCARPPAATLASIATVEPVVIDESSGLAASRRSADILWTHNDSDGAPVLYAIGLDGKLRGSVRVEGLKNIDWEDMTSFELDGRAWLMVGDIGENIKRTVGAAVYVIPEPAASELSPERETVVPVAWTIPVRYADGPHDCESLAVDVREGRVYLLRKREETKPLYSLPLRPAIAGQPTPEAQRLGIVGHIPQPNSEQRAVPIATGRYRANPTAMDISADGRRAVVLTYGDVLLFERKPGETWAKALAAKPRILPPHGLAQAEAACFSRDGRSIFVTEEKLHTAVLRYDLTPLSSP